MEKIKTALHSGDMGDIVAGMASLKEIADRDKCKFILYLDTTGGMTVNNPELNRIIERQSNHRGLKFNHSAFQFLEPLLSYQPYIANVIEHGGSQPLPAIDYNLNQFRRCFCDKEIIVKSNQNLLYLHNCAFDLEMGYKGPWLTIPKDDGEELLYDTVVARTSRYQSAHVFYAAYENRLKEAQFIGTDFEYALWENAFGWKPIRHPVENALQAAIAIAGAKHFISNGTLFYWIAVGLGHKSIVHELGCDIPTTYGKDFPNVKYIQGFHEVK